MGGSSFGTLFCVTTWGESHGPAVGVVIDGCPPGIDLIEEDIQTMLDRRKPGSSAASTARKEEDLVTILSGTFEGKTTGTPIMLLVKNKDARSSSYTPLARLFRPGHGDYSYLKKYGIRDHRGGGRASARETVARVAAGAVAGRILASENIHVVSCTLELGGVKAKKRNLKECSANPFLCPDKDAAEQMASRVAEVKARGDSLGGIVEVCATGVPAGLGEPVFDKLDARIAMALMSIGAVKGVEIGSGFEAARMLGSQNNDAMDESGFLGNNAGGILAGISSGAPVVARVAVKPIPSVSVEQKTVDIDGNATTVSVKGRHDISAIPRINVVTEAMMNLVLADFLLRQKAIKQQ